MSYNTEKPSAVKRESNPRAVIGSNSNVADLTERKAQFLAELTQFAAERKREEALTRQQLAELPI
jgi:hypothetical protein